MPTLKVAKHGKPLSGLGVKALSASHYFLSLQRLSFRQAVRDCGSLAPLVRSQAARATGDGGLIFPFRRRLLSNQTNEISKMPLNEIAASLVTMAEQADALCRALPGHRLHMPLRDLSLAIEHAATALSEPCRKHIARN
jgi:hypothetical protein